MSIDHFKDSGKLSSISTNEMRDFLKLSGCTKEILPADTGKSGLVMSRWRKDLHISYTNENSTLDEQIYNGMEIISLPEALGLSKIKPKRNLTAAKLRHSSYSNIKLYEGGDSTFTFDELDYLPFKEKGVSTDQGLSNLKDIKSIFTLLRKVVKF